ncbi:MAG: type II toxin-antitoxin system RelE/ParE family toxin [Nitrososphaerota archaeon]|jgi:mRNA-degrading endonuclease RelE of RelBE toxin-antitoxin system|nr:type II toxin-antitoxin system RelE/ParE family toxin [Nitrososphaerota archaeon]MDG6961634.1 type II toxin-antitoxin system RelE/ParE family toxin [Nitrososphaerota archaeon]MDG6971155.1 type II toxin-antitoxin system RelE/ParE family toxin [Nitrososphaerota archaeon]MDG6972826.1 type II toxin-antitoxin system RelE/ParE family toxin [Nitrososphaerota archaeon]MDG6993089.1 type II toxin-antitoxin system RelE/ParE family toxin [Nitrososphaerota archaeon]
MVVVKEIVYTQKFERDVRKLRDGLVKERLSKQIRKIAEDPEIGKPLRYGLKDEWTARIAPYRLIYAVQGDRLVLLRFEHRKSVYD